MCSLVDDAIKKLQSVQLTYFIAFVLYNFIEVFCNITIPFCISSIFFSYLSACKPFCGPLVSTKSFAEPPQLLMVPTYKWMITVYVQDILGRLNDVKVAITSTYGSILKLDSSKKVYSHSVFHVMT